MLARGTSLYEIHNPEARESIMYQNQLALEAALMELTLHVETQRSDEVGDNVRGALWVIGENAGHINHSLARLKNFHDPAALCF